MEKRTRWSTAKAREVLTEQEKSGQSLREFCKERGWPPQRLLRWKRRLETMSGSRTEAATARPAFARVEVASAARVATAQWEASPVLFELVLRTGQRLRFPAEVEPEVLSRTVRTLEVGPC